MDTPSAAEREPRGPSSRGSASRSAGADARPWQAERDGGRLSLLSAVLANLSIALAKGVAFAFTGSTAMLAEGLHSVADTSKQGLLFLGRARARSRPDAEHPFGTVRSSTTGP